MNTKATYIAPTVKIHTLISISILAGTEEFGSIKNNPIEGKSKSSIADFGDTSDFDEAPSSSWDNSTY